MSFILLTVWILGAFCIVKSHTKTYHKTVSKKRFWLATILLACIIAWGGEKPSPEEPTPDEPEIPDEPLPPAIEGVKVKLIGRYENGKFVPLTSEWIDSTNIVETIKEITNEN